MEISEGDTSLPTPNFHYSKTFNVRRGSARFSHSFQCFPKLSLNSDSSPQENVYEGITQPIPLSNNDSLYYCENIRDPGIILSRTGVSKTNQNYELIGNSSLEHRFDILQKIGEGSFGIVYRVRDCQTQSLYALKMAKKISGNFSNKFLFLKEAENLRKIGTHINVVKFYSVWEHDDHIFMQLELCYCSLKDIIMSRGPIIATDFYWVLKDIVSGIKYIHDKNFIHLDIKPDNLFLSVNLKLIKIGDFGMLYKLSDPLVTAFEGDNKYMAPELLVKTFGKPADIFSLGITLLELLTNIELPSGGQLWHELRHEEFSSLNVEISQSFKEITFMMLRTDPDKRASINELYAISQNFYYSQTERASNIFSSWLLYILFVFFSTIGFIFNTLFEKNHKNIPFLQSNHTTISPIGIHERRKNTLENSFSSNSSNIQNFNSKKLSNSSPELTSTPYCKTYNFKSLDLDNNSNDKSKIHDYLQIQPKAYSSNTFHYRSLVDKNNFSSRKLVFD